MRGESGALWPAEVPIRAMISPGSRGAPSRRGRSRDGPTGSARPDPPYRPRAAQGAIAAGVPGAVPAAATAVAAIAEESRGMVLSLKTSRFYFRAFSHSLTLR
jgi:hypothetical protein